MVIATTGGMSVSQGQDGVLFASPQQVRLLADIVQRISEQVKGGWVSAATHILGQDGWEITSDLLEHLRDEVGYVLECLPAYLQGEEPVATPQAPPLRVLAGRQHGELVELPLPSLERLYSLLSDYLVRAAAGYLPEDWPARVGVDLERRVSGAIRRIAGITPGDAALDLEATLQAQRQRLERTLGQLVNAEEEERQHIAREVHDALAQSLAAANVQAQAAQRTLADSPERAAEEIANVQQLIRDALVEVREVIFDLRPASLERLGLREAVHDYADHICAGHSLNVAVAGTGDTATLLPTQETVLFRVIQEALSNVCKHSGASRADVTIDVMAAVVQVEVSDNGCGFDAAALPASPEGGHHCGLAFARERIALAGGEFSLTSRPGQGTTVHIVLPR